MPVFRPLRDRFKFGAKFELGGKFKFSKIIFGGKFKFSKKKFGGKFKFFEKNREFGGKSETVLWSLVNLKREAHCKHGDDNFSFVLYCVDCMYFWRPLCMFVYWMNFFRNHLRVSGYKKLSRII